MNAAANPKLEELLPDAPDTFTELAPKPGDGYETSDADFDDPEPEFDGTQDFDPIDDGKPNSPTGRPDDFPGFESLEVLLTAGGRYKAGKSYRPDPSGVRRAVKVDDYALGTNFYARFCGSRAWSKSLQSCKIYRRTLISS